MGAGERAQTAHSGRRFVLDCGVTGMEGRTLSVTGLAPLRDEVLVRLRLGSLETTGMLTASRPELVVPGAPGIAAPSGGQDGPGVSSASSASSTPSAAGGPGAAVPSGARGSLTTVRELAVTGAAHLLTGPDHVLFVIGLLLLVRRARALAGAITAFTLAHSLTLALQVLGAVRLAPAPVEAAIALSVLLLAREILRPREEGTLAQRRPWVVAFGFGLLHGLGFAGGLGALGVPEAQIPAALLGFNLGLEAAQLALVAAALGLAAVARPLATRLPRWAHRAPAYGIGAFAAFWTLQRVGAFLG